MEEDISPEIQPTLSDPTDKPPKNYKFNFAGLEDVVTLHYEKIIVTDTAETRTELFKGIFGLTHAILSTGNYSKFGILDYREVAMEYATDLFERIVLGKFRPVYVNRMPWNKYIKLNIRGTLYKDADEVPWDELVSDMEYLLSPDVDHSHFLVDVPSPERNIRRYELADRLIATLKIYYPIDEIKRLLNISLDMLYTNPRKLLLESMPMDVRDFGTILISVAKRLMYESNVRFGFDVPKSHLTKVFTSSIRSTVFLSSIVSSDFFPKELLLSLDSDSLSRLVYVMGGKTVRIPTQTELDTLVGAVVTVSKMVLNGDSLNKALGNTRKEMDLVFSRKVNIHNFITKALECHNIFQVDQTNKSTPIVNMCILTIKSIEKVLENLSNKVETAPAEDVLKSYVELSDTLNKFTQNLISISAALKTKASESVLQPEGKENGKA